MTNPHDFSLSGIHHVAYRCRNAKETVAFYERVLNMQYTSAFAENTVPSTGEYDPYMHVFLDCGNGNVLAFFELPNQPEMGRDTNTPAWVQHIAFRVPDMTTLLAGKARAEAAGLGRAQHQQFGQVLFHGVEKLRQIRQHSLRQRVGAAALAVEDRPGDAVIVAAKPPGAEGSDQCG